MSEKAASRDKVTERLPWPDARRPLRLQFAEQPTFASISSATATSHATSKQRFQPGLRSQQEDDHTVRQPFSLFAIYRLPAYSTALRGPCAWQYSCPQAVPCQESLRPGLPTGILPFPCSRKPWMKKTDVLALSILHTRQGQAKPFATPRRR